MVMNNIDPDILASLKAHDIGGERNAEVHRLINAKRARDEQLINQIETQLELLADGVEAVLPRTHPKFQSVLLLTFIRRITRAQQLREAKQQSDFDAYLDGRFPPGW